MASFQDNLGKLVPECPTILDFAVATDDGGTKVYLTETQTSTLTFKSCYDHHIHQFCQFTGNLVSHRYKGKR